MPDAPRCCLQVVGSQGRRDHAACREAADLLAIPSEPNTDWQKRIRQAFRKCLAPLTATEVLGTPDLSR